MLKFCFGDLGLHRAQALIHPDNAALLGARRETRIRCEGRLRDNLRVGDEWRDDMLYALLADDDPTKPDLIPSGLDTGRGDAQPTPVRGD